MSEGLIYLDNNSTTKLDTRVLEAMLPFFTDEYGNASSNHLFGTRVNQKVKEAREKVAELIGSEPNEIIFTSGATEAINLAIKGVLANDVNKKHIVTVATEHPAVLDTCKYLEGIGFEVTYLPVQSDGILDLEIVKQNVTKNTALVCVMFVNNETGVIQPIREIAQIAHSNSAFFMTDATQAVGKLPISVDDLGIDLMAFSGHKFYGPKGIGGLYVRSKRPNKVRLDTLLHGGGHEKGLRSGTLNVPGIVGLGRAVEIALVEMQADSKRIKELRDYLERELLKIEDTFLNGHPTSRLYNVSNVCFKGADADAIVIDLKNIIVSNGSACSSTKVEPSHVLRAMGISTSACYSSLRFSLSKFNKDADIVTTIDHVKEIVYNLRSMNI